MDLALLQAAARLGDATAPIRLLPEELRFSLVYAAPPDVSAERARLAALFGADGFQLFVQPPGDDSDILVLQFPGVPRRQSTDYLMGVADTLGRELGLAACVPDADAGWLAEDELNRAAPESLGGIVWQICTSHAGAPSDPRWSVKAVKADKAWQRFNTRGATIRIGQPDTGVADHTEIARGIDLAAGLDVILGSGRPIDPLAGSMGSPGHGTATSSVVASRTDGLIAGTAPEATLVPIRCVNSVILSSGTAVAAAIDHARAAGCDIVTMSLGGPFAFPALRRAIGRAVDAGMIVMAAAGNCVRIVVYPAWDENVIAVAAVAQAGKPWTGTSVGAKVDVSAPGEDVYVARRTSASDALHSLVEPGQGTSFAVATLAGCAALWLAHHTRAKVRSAAAAKGVSVQELFRAAVRATTWQPPGWDSAGMGTGIVDAEALLALKLADIRPAAPIPVESAHPAYAELGPGFDWRRYGAEAGYLALDRAQRADPRRALALESSVPPQPSAGFRAAAAAAGAPGALAAPLVVSPPSTPPLAPGRAMRLVAQGKSGGAEASGLITERSARSFLQGGGRKEVLDTIDAVDRSLAVHRAPDAADELLRQRLRERMEGVIDRFASGEARSTADFRGEDRVAAEALVSLTGRPALRVVDGKVDIENPQLGAWHSDIFMTRDLLKPIIQAIGRIDVEIDGVHIHVGTGTLLEPGVVMTNRHVIEAFAEPLPPFDGAYDIFNQASIIFDDDAADNARRFRIKGVIAAGSERIGRFADARKLDMAFLEVESVNGGGRALPKAAPSGALPAENSGLPRIAIVGYPGRPEGAAFVDPETGKASAEISDAIWRIYHNDYGVKYISPGEIRQPPGGFADGGRRWAFSHDATTLGGNSGSAAVSLGSGFTVCGLHFGGAPLRYNLAHSIQDVRRMLANDPSLMGGQWPI